jgi:hypothetical protein
MTMDVWHIHSGNLMFKFCPYLVRLIVKPMNVVLFMLFSKSGGRHFLVGQWESCYYLQYMLAKLILFQTITCPCSLCTRTFTSGLWPFATPTFDVVSLCLEGSCRRNPKWRRRLLTTRIVSYVWRFWIYLQRS